MAFPIILRLRWKGKVIHNDSDRPEGVVIRAWRSILKASNRAIGFHWHAHFLPLHFGSDAARRYGSGVYKTRTRKWLARKLRIESKQVDAAAGIAPGDSQEERRRKRMISRQNLVSQAGGANYNVFRGTLRQMVLGTVVMRAFPGRFRIEMPVPGYLPGRRKDPNQPDIRAELSAMLPGEVSELMKIGQRALTKSVRHVLQTGNLPEGV